MFYACVAIGMADCTPTVQNYISGVTQEEFAEELLQVTQEWDAENPHHHVYAFRMPRRGEDNYSQRIRVAKEEDYVVDVIGMNGDDWEREQAS